MDEIPRVNVNWEPDDAPPRVPRNFPSLGYIKKKLRPYDESELQVAAGGPRRAWEGVWYMDEEEGRWVKRDVRLGSKTKGGTYRTKRNNKNKNQNKNKIKKRNKTRHR